uniref:Uncharacterized protein n=1 Tax=Cannabis sativa TaxID=3483 RepID=A0A803NFV8_CANSA
MKRKENSKKEGSPSARGVASVDQVAGATTASTQKLLGDPKYNNIHLTLSSTVMFILSAKLFCCGVLVQLNVSLYPCLQNFLNLSAKNSKPLSGLSLLSFFPFEFLAIFSYP